MTVSEAIQLLHNMRCSGDMPYHFRVAIAEVINVLLMNTQEVEHGHWIDCKGSDGKDYRKCSKCLHTQNITGLLNYCPVCGARMDE